MQLPSIRPHQPPVQPVNLAPVDSPVRATPAIPSAEAAPALELNAYRSVQEAVKTLPAARPEEVARGKELANSPTYPPLAIINALAKLFVNEGTAAPQGDQ